MTLSLEMDQPGLLPQLLMKGGPVLLTLLRWTLETVFHHRFLYNAISQDLDHLA